LKTNATALGVSRAGYEESRSSAGSSPQAQLRAQLAGLSYAEQLERVSPVAAARAARATLSPLQRGEGLGAGPLQLKVDKPRATREQSQAKDEIEGFVRAGALHDAKDKLRTLDPVYQRALMEYKLDKHAGSPVEWTKYWMVTRRAMAGKAAGAGFGQLYGKGTLSWVQASCVRGFLEFVSNQDVSERAQFYEFMLRLGDPEVIRLLKVDGVANGLAAINVDHYQRTFSRYWPQVAENDDTDAENAILVQVQAGNLAAARTLVQNGNPAKLIQFYLHRRQTGDPSLYTRLLLVVPAASIFIVGDSIAPDLRAGAYDWLTSPALALYVIAQLQTLAPTAMIEALKNSELRARLAAHGGDAYAELVDSTPILRIGAEVEEQVDVSDPDIDLDELAQAAFEAFLGDLPVSQLHYCTNSIDFKPIDALLGKPAAAKGAPCMMLSSVFAHILGQWPHAVNMTQAGDDRPLLTKPLAAISTRGTLTRDPTFKGNVAHYDGTDDFDTINRVFFGDGHIWLEFNGRQYDPTLGISGPGGTVQAAVEDFYVRGDNDTFTKGNLSVTKHDAPLPPGGGPLRFDRAIRIERDPG
jgi:hypothetical protein